MKQSISKTPTVLSPADYLANLIEATRHAEKHIVITSMTVSVGKRLMSLFHELTKACERGVAVELYFDNYSRSSRRERYRSESQTSGTTRQALTAIEQAGGLVAFTGKLGLNPYSGRIHNKTAIIDSDVYSFGGINMSEDALDSTDYMLHLSDSKLAEASARMLHAYYKDSDKHDKAYAIDSSNELLFDGGMPGHSLIYDRVCDLAKNARVIYFSSRMCPSGKLARLITQTENYCFYNRPEDAPLPTAATIIFDQLRYGLQNRQTSHTYRHAKFILFEDNTGSRSLVTGSHNFNYRGVRFGTMECALFSRDEKLWQHLFDHYLENKA